MIPAGELAAMQQEVANSLDLTADIQRNSSNTFVLGQPTSTYQSILPGGVPVACGMTPPTQAQAQVYADLIGTKQATIFFFALGQSIQRSDHVIQAGITWTVQAPLFPESYQLATKALCTRID